MIQATNLNQWQYSRSTPMEMLADNQRWPYRTQECQILQVWRIRKPLFINPSILTQHSSRISLIAPWWVTTKRRDSAVLRYLLQGGLKVVEVITTRKANSMLLMTLILMETLIEENLLIKTNLSQWWTSVSFKKTKCWSNKTHSFSRSKDSLAECRNRISKARKNTICIMKTLQLPNRIRKSKWNSMKTRKLSIDWNPLLMLRTGNAKWNTSWTRYTIKQLKDNS